MKRITIVLFLALVGLRSAWAQTCADCTATPDDPVCVAQNELVAEGMTLTVDGCVDEKSCGAIIGGGTFDRYFRFEGVFPTKAQQDLFYFCEFDPTVVGPDGKPGWYRFRKPAPGAAPAGPSGDPVALVKAMKDKARTDREKAETLLEEERKKEAELLVKIWEGLGVWMGVVDWVFLGGTVGSVGEGVMGGGTLRLHVPVGPYRSGIEFGAIAGYAGMDPEVRRVHFLGQVGPVVEGVFMPRSWLGFTLGLEWAHLIPDESDESADFVGARMGVQLNPTRWLPVRLTLRAGGLLRHEGDWEPNGGGEVTIGLHF